LRKALDAKGGGCLERKVASLKQVMIDDSMMHL